MCRSGSLVLAARSQHKEADGGLPAGPGIRIDPVPDTPRVDFSHNGSRVRCSTFLKSVDLAACEMTSADHRCAIYPSEAQNVAKLWPGLWDRLVHH